MIPFQCFIDIIQFIVQDAADLGMGVVVSHKSDQSFKRALVFRLGMDDHGNNASQRGFTNFLTTKKNMSGSLLLSNKRLFGKQD